MPIEGICFRMQSEIQQMVKLQIIDFILECIWKKNKAFAYRVSIGDYNYQQCTKKSGQLIQIPSQKIRSTKPERVKQLNCVCNHELVNFQFFTSPFNNSALNKFTSKKKVQTTHLDSKFGDKVNQGELVVHNHEIVNFQFFIIKSNYFNDSIILSFY